MHLQMHGPQVLAESRLVWVVRPVQSYFEHRVRVDLVSISLNSSISSTLYTYTSAYIYLSQSKLLHILTIKLQVLGALICRLLILVE